MSSPLALVSLELDQALDNPRLVAEWRTTVAQIAGANVIPVDASLQSSTLLGHALQQALLVPSIAALAVEQGMRSLIFAATLAALAVCVLAVLDVSAVLLGSAQGVLLDVGTEHYAVQRAVMLLADFIDHGGRLFAAALVGAVCWRLGVRMGCRASWLGGSRRIGMVVLCSTLAMLTCSPELWAQSAVPAVAAGKIDGALWQQLVAGKRSEALVLFAHDEVDRLAAEQRRQRGVRFDDVQIMAHRVLAYEQVKRTAWARLGAAPGVRELRDYGQLPVSFVEIASVADAARLLALDEVVALMPNLQYTTELAQSLPLINQPPVATLGEQGEGATVAILDTGVDYTKTAFGSCSAPGVPASCAVVAAVDIAPNDNVRDDSGHGTNVAGIAVGVAPKVNIAALDVFDGATTSAAYLTDAINWAIQSRVIYNIVAMNFSLGDGGRYTSTCGVAALNPLKTPLDNARSAGIQAVAASGNSGYKDGIANPACTPGVISVGAVYDASFGAASWGVCSDSVTVADRVACFSNSASFLTMLAPGAQITAAGYTYSGTSQATPHVAGALAVLRSAYPTLGLGDVESKLQSSGSSPVDPGNGIAKPRLDLRAAVGALNDRFVDAVLLTSATGTSSVASAGATKEAGEPAHAGVTGGASVWWSWTPTTSGWTKISTAGSTFDTSLGVYVGDSVAALRAVASNDNRTATDSSSEVTFYASVGVTYRIAIDGVAGKTGIAVLSWQAAIAPAAEEDVPFLPLWAWFALASVLVGAAGRRRRGDGLV